MNKPEVKIIDRLNIKSCYLIVHKDSIWEGQNLFHLTKNKKTKENEKENETNRKPSAYLFHPLSVKLHYYLCIDGSKVGTRYCHGTGRKGFHFPEVATHFHDTEEGARKALSSLSLYFKDLAEKSVYGPRTLRAGQINSNWHLFE